MDFYVLKWGHKYGPEYVNRLYGSLVKHYKKPFTFTCYTDNISHLDENVKVKNIKDLKKFDTEIENFWDVVYKIKDILESTDDYELSELGEKFFDQIEESMEEGDASIENIRDQISG